MWYLQQLHQSKRASLILLLKCKYIIIYARLQKSIILRTAHNKPTGLAKDPEKGWKRTL